jgi:DNA-binding XRE family transcriptional regulator
MPKKKTFSDDQYDAIFEAAQRVRKKFKTQELMALGLGLSQQSVANLLIGKYRPSVQYAREIAILDGRTLEDLVGEGVPGTAYGDGISPVASSHFPNLETCLRFFQKQKTWSPWTVACARAAFFGSTDHEPPEWEKRLDGLETSLAKLRK